MTRVLEGVKPFWTREEDECIDALLSGGCRLEDLGDKIPSRSREAIAARLQYRVVNHLGVRRYGGRGGRPRKAVTIVERAAQADHRRVIRDENLARLFGTSVAQAVPPSVAEQGQSRKRPAPSDEGYLGRDSETYAVPASDPLLAALRAAHGEEGRPDYYPGAGRSAA